MMYNIKKLKFTAYDYQQWIEHFLQNDRNRLHIDFSEEKKLKEDEKKLIFSSIPVFQKGEGSEGRHLLSVSMFFAKKVGQRDYPYAMELFIREENWHSAYLAKYMQFHGIKKREKYFLAEVFQQLRRMGSIRSEVVVLLTAEIIALSYYTALANATSSSVLKKICRQMVKDELPHVIFQSYTLSHLKETLLQRVVRILLMEITTMVVWLAFRHLFTAGRYSFRRLRRENQYYLKQSIQIVTEKGKIHTEKCGGKQKKRWYGIHNRAQ